MLGGNYPENSYGRKSIYTKNIVNNINIKTRKICNLSNAMCNVWNVLLYGCETWTMNEQNKRKLEAMEMWM